jgi:hypothetical protein
MSKIYKVEISVYDELDIGNNILDVSYYSDYHSAIKGAIKKEMDCARECDSIQSFLICDIYSCEYDGDISYIDDEKSKDLDWEWEDNNM